MRRRWFVETSNIFLVALQRAGITEIISIKDLVSMLRATASSYRSCGDEREAEAFEAFANAYFEDDAK